MRFTFRHSLILIVYLVILFRGIIPTVETVAHQSAWDFWVFTLLLSAPLLALLVVVFERTSPVKNWSVSFLLFLFFPALILNHDCIVLVEFVREGKSPTLWATLLLNAMGVGFTLVYASRMVPRPCPGCQRRALIRLMRLFTNEERSANTFWCASCGGKYWKDSTGTWRSERRRTWLDRLQETRPFGGRKATAAGRPEVAETVVRPLALRSVNETQPS